MTLTKVGWIVVVALILLLAIGLFLIWYFVGGDDNDEGYW